jgi:hypothetical protein
MSSPTTKTTRVLIFSTAADRDWARQLRAQLRQSGVPAGLDPEDLEPGEDWGEAIREAVVQSSHVVFLVNRDAATSPMFQFKMGMALGGKKGIIPIVAEDVPPDDIPEPMRRRHPLRKRAPEKVAQEIAELVG